MGQPPQKKVGKRIGATEPLRESRSYRKFYRKAFLGSLFFCLRARTDACDAATCRPGAYLHRPRDCGSRSFGVPEKPRREEHSAWCGSGRQFAALPHGELPASVFFLFEESHLLEKSCGEISWGVLSILFGPLSKRSFEDLFANKLAGQGCLPSFLQPFSYRTASTQTSLDPSQSAGKYLQPDSASDKGVNWKN